MNQADIIKLAREAGADTQDDGRHWEFDGFCPIRFAALVAAAEREACAKVCDELHWPWHMGDNSGPKECATAIRARGGK